MRFADVSRMRCDHLKASKMIANIRRDVLVTARRVRGLPSFKVCVLTTSKRIGGLQSFGECAFTTAKRVGGWQSFGGCVLIILNACRDLEFAF